MTNIVTLDYLKKQADEKYAPYQIEMDKGKILTIRNPMRVESSVREHVTELKKELTEIYDKIEEDEEGNPIGDLEPGDDARLHGIMLEMLNICGDSKKLSEDLNEQLRTDLGMTQIIFYDWLGDDEVGEASNSAD